MKMKKKKNIAKRRKEFDSMQIYDNEARQIKYGFVVGGEKKKLENYFVVLRFAIFKYRASWAGWELVSFCTPNSVDTHTQL